MAGRSRSIYLAGVPFTTPLLIPSVSTKGFPVDSEGKSESALLVELALDGLTEALLVSAYDLEHRGLNGSEDFLQGKPAGSVMEQPRLLVVDSGGYETGKAWEGGHSDREDRKVQTYGLATFVSVLDRLPADRTTLVVSYDGPDQVPGSYTEQIKRGRELFNGRGKFASDMLLKPEAGRRWHDSLRLAPAASDLQAFDVVGFTEKELGDSLLSRLVTLARLRGVLDTASVLAPIHVFGALDPLLTPLYFAAGAEIFDGLSWLKYVYHDGLAVHPDAGSLLRGEQDDSQRFREGKRVVQNLGRLSELRRSLQRSAQDKHASFSEFGDYANVLADTYGTMLARLKTREV